MKDTAYFLGIYESIKSNIKKSFYIEDYKYLFKTGIEYQFENIIVWKFMGNVCLDFSLLWKVQAGLLWAIETDDGAKPFQEFICAVDALYEIDVFKMLKGNQTLILNSIEQALAWEYVKHEKNKRFPHLQAFSERFSSVMVCYTVYSSKQQ